MMLERAERTSRPLFDITLLLKMNFNEDNQ